MPPAIFIYTLKLFCDRHGSADEDLGRIPIFLCLIGFEVFLGKSTLIHLKQLPLKLHVKCLSEVIEMICTIPSQIVSLQKKYPSIYGAPVIDRLDNSIFEIPYHGQCFSYICNDRCCARGVDIDIENVGRIMHYADDIERFTNIPRTEWFLEDYQFNNEFPGSQYTRTRVKDNSCVFANKTGRGCLIHKFCLETNLDFHVLKPMVSSLFPLTFDEGLLHPADEVMDRSLMCLKPGPTLYQGCRQELIYYFGPGLVEELDALEKSLSLDLAGIVW